MRLRATVSSLCRAAALIAAVLAAVLAGSVAAPAQESTTFQPRCVVVPIDAAPHAVCDTGPVGGGRINHVMFQKEGTTGAAEASFVSFTTVGKVAAVLHVIDRADRRRARIVGLEAADAARMIEAARVAGVSNRFGVAQIGDRFEILAQIGAQRDEVSRVTAAIRADGTIGDSGKLLVEAIQQLKLAQAERHVLVLSSDGKPEDRTYARDDVIRAARDAKVVVVSVGYKERPDAPELQSLKRLADETGGLYLEAPGPSNRLDDASVNRYAQFVGSGGTATFPLNRNDPRGRYALTLEMDAGRTLSGSFVADVPAALGQQLAQQGGQPGVSGPLTGQGNAPPGGAAGQTIPRVRIPDPPSGPPLAERSGLDNIGDWVAGEWRDRPWAVIGVPVLLVLGIGGVVLLQMLRRRRIKVYAWLELFDPGRTRVPVAGTAVRLGRHSENDIKFENPSVHRFHAVLTREPENGQFVVTDVSRDQPSSNGVVVNGELVAKSPLANGDVVELGEVKFRFLYA